MLYWMTWRIFFQVGAKVDHALQGGGGRLIVYKFAEKLK